MKLACLRLSTVLVLTAAAAGCGGDPDGVLVQLAPDVVSSEDGTLHVSSMVIRDHTPQSGETVRLTVAYTDRNGTEHSIDGAEGVTDERGRFVAVLSGFTFEGTGTVTAEVIDGGGQPITGGDGAPLASEATFSVLDRTPPTVTIVPPTTDLHIGAGLPLSVSVEVSDEIGVSEVFLEISGEVNRLRSTVVASGATEATLQFDFDIPEQAAPGPNLTLHALASDLSGNQAAAEAVTLTIDPAIAIATPPGLMGSQLVEGDNQTLDDPTALALSPMDGMLYVADNSQGSPCNDACIRAVDPGTGAVQAGAITVGQGRIEGIAFDATGDNMFFSDRQDRIGHMTWNGTNYVDATDCNNPDAGGLQQPAHLIFDATLGILVAEQNDRRVKQVATCDVGSVATSLTQEVFENPTGIAAGAAGEYYVSDTGRGLVRQVQSNGDTSLFESRRLERPRGLVWLAGGGSDFADSLLVADSNQRRVVSTRGNGDNSVPVFLRNFPVDVELDGGTLYVLTRPSVDNNGRIFVVTGF